MVSPLLMDAFVNTCLKLSQPLIENVNSLHESNEIEPSSEGPIQSKLFNLEGHRKHS